MYRSVDYVQIIGIAALMALGQVYSSFPDDDRSYSGSNNQRYEYSTSIDVPDVILEQIVLAMESHVISSRKLYEVACSALSTLWGCNDIHHQSKPIGNNNEDDSS